MPPAAVIPPSAERFEKWVFDEVLPSIRSHGAYITDETIEKIMDSPSFAAQLLQELYEESCKNMELNSLVDELVSKAMYYDRVLDGKDAISISIFAKDYGMSAVKFYEAPEEERNLNTLVEMINAMEVREDDESFKNAVDRMFDLLEERDPQHFAVRQYKKYKLAAGKTAKSILISCGARLAPFDIKELRELIAYDEMELDTLGDRKTALFVIISDTNFLVALMYTQLFNLLCDKAEAV